MKRILRCWPLVLVLYCFVGAMVHPTAQAVEEACGPISGSDAFIRSTTYYFCNSSQGLHEALDICNGSGSSCGYCGCDGNQSAWHRAMTINLKLYQYNLGFSTPCANNCEGTSGKCNKSSDNNCHGGAGNYFVVQGTNGWDFRQLHLNHSEVYSYTKYAVTGNRIGHLGSTGHSTAPHVHADNRRNGVRMTDWYAGVVTCGFPATSDDLVGYLQLQ